jgi:hypothetical protein
MRRGKQPRAESPSAPAEQGLESVDRLSQPSETNPMESFPNSEDELRLNLQHRELEIDQLNHTLAKFKQSLEHLRKVENERDYFKDKYTQHIEQIARDKRARLDKIKMRLGGVIGEALGLEVGEEVDEVEALVGNVEDAQRRNSDLAKENERLLDLYNTERLRNAALANSLEEIKKLGEQASSKRQSAIQELQAERDKLSQDMLLKDKAIKDLDAQLSILKKGCE